MTPGSRRSRARARLPLVALIAWRYMAHPRSRVLSATAWAALLATALGVTAMVVAMALMTGYSEDLERKLVGLQAEISAVPLELEIDTRSDPRIAAAGALESVASVGRAGFGDGALAGPNGEDVVVFLRGVDPHSDPRVERPEQLAPGSGGLPRILVGTELGRSLGLEVGGRTRLVVMDPRGRRPRFRYKSVEVGGTFTTGFSEFDRAWVVLDREVLAELRGPSGLGEVVEFHLADGADADVAAARIAELLGEDFAVHSPKALNRDLFMALDLQKLGLFVVIGLIVLVSTFNIASTLVILVRERMRDIGVLSAIGFEPRQMVAVFVVYGVLLGGFGIAFGAGCGTAISWLLTHFEVISFGPEVAAIYFIDAVPFRVRPQDLAAVVGFASLITLAVCIWPAMRAARIRPADALRYE